MSAEGEVDIVGQRRYNVDVARGVLDPRNEFFLDPPVKPDAIAAEAFSTVQEECDGEVDWYRRLFAENEHDNFIGKHDEFRGVVIVSILATQSRSGKQYWTIVWRRDSIDHKVFDCELNEELTLYQLFERLDPLFLKYIKYFHRVSKNKILEDELVKLENDEPNQTIKIGVLYARDGQTDENDMFGNETGSERFDEFLNLLGDRVALKGLNGRYLAQLDTKNDNSGTHSVHRLFNKYDVMFHVSTLLRYDKSDVQHIQRKRFIGNDIVVIVFVDGKTTYSVETMKSQYTNILLIVQPDDDPTKYRFACGGKIGLRQFGPEAATIYNRDQAFIEFLLTKCINGEKATCASPEFLIRERRTRGSYLDIIYEKAYSKGKAAAKFSQKILHRPNDLGQNQPQAFAPVGVAEVIPGEVRAAAAAAERAFFATAQGLVSSEIAKHGSFTNVASLDNIVQLQVCPELNVLFVRTGPPQALIFAFSLPELLEDKAPVVTMIPNTKNADYFCAKAIGETVYLAVSMTTAVMIYEARGTVYSTVKLVQAPGNVTMVRFTNSGLLMGFTSPTENGFMYAAINGPAKIKLHTGKDLPMAAFASPSSVTLCYKNEGIVIRPDGKRDTTVKPSPWVAVPLHFSQEGPYLVISYPTFVEVRTLNTLVLVETHLIRAPRPFLSDGPWLPVYNPENSTTTVCHLMAIPPKHRHGGSGSPAAGGGSGGVHVSRSISLPVASTAPASTNPLSNINEDESSSSSSSSDDEDGSPVQAHRPPIAEVNILEATAPVATQTVPSLPTASLQPQAEITKSSSLPSAPMAEKPPVPAISPKPTSRSTSPKSTSPMISPRPAVTPRRPSLDPTMTDSAIVAPPHDLESYEQNLAELIANLDKMGSEMADDDDDEVEGQAIVQRMLTDSNSDMASTQYESAAASPVSSTGGSPAPESRFKHPDVEIPERNRSAGKYATMRRPAPSPTARIQAEHKRIHRRSISSLPMHAERFMSGETFNAPDPKNQAAIIEERKAQTSKVDVNKLTALWEQKK